MTDARLDVTRRRLLALARLYFEHVGATVTEDGDRWTVTLPSEDCPLSSAANDRTLRLTTAADSVSASDGHTDRPATEGEATDASAFADLTTDTDSQLLPLVPGSDFSRQLVDAAGAVTPVSALAISRDRVDPTTLLPEWVTNTPATVRSTRFHPYYDDRLVAVWVRCEMETPSPYQREQLRIVLIDPDTDTPVTDCDLTPLTTLSSAALSETPAAAVATNASADGSLHETVETAQEVAVADLEDEVEAMRREAGSAAATDLAEYRDLQRDRMATLQTEIESVEDRLSSVADNLADGGSDVDRGELLRRREQLRTERDRLSDELAAIRDAKATGYEPKRRELITRHTVDVRTRPVAVSILAVERGDLEVVLADDGGTHTLRFSCDLLRGPPSSEHCPRCGDQLTASNPVRVRAGEQSCRGCSPD